MTEAFVRLDDATRSEYAKTMAHIWTRVEELRAKKARDSKKTQDDIDGELEEIGRLCRLINDDGQPRDQMDLFAGQGDSRVTEETAKRELAALKCRRPDCTVINSRVCGIHGSCSCGPGEGGPEDFDGEAPAVKSPTCVLHGVEAPHATEPPAPEAVEETEPQIIERTAAEAVAEWAAKDITPESVADRNALVKAAIAATSMPVRRRRAFGQAVARLLSDQPSVPAGQGATTAPAVEEPGDDVGNREAEA